MPGLEELKQEKKHTKKQRSHFKRSSTRWLKLSLKIGRLNKRIRRKKKALDSTVHLVERFLDEAIRDTKLGLHYLWGGGHLPGDPAAHPNGPWDCSGWALHLLATVVEHVNGSGMNTIGFMNAARSKSNGLEEGEGRWITFYVKDDHMVTRVVFRGRTYWMQCGGSDNPKPGDGPTFWHPTPERIREFTFHCHPKGL